MAFYKKKNEMGSISFDRQLIEFACAHTILGFDGTLITSDSKGRLKKGADKNPYGETGFIDGIVNEEGLIDIRIYLVIRFGQSMNNISELFAQRLRMDVRSAIGMELGEITVVFVGTLAKQLAKRHLEFTYSR